MESSSFATLAVLFVVLLSSRPAVVEGKFVDMHEKMFQAELLDDCSAYVYDRVLLFNTPRNDWCVNVKSSFNAYLSNDTKRHLIIVAIYRDHDHFVKISYSNETKKFLPQDYFEVDYGTRVFFWADDDATLKYDPNGKNSFKTLKTEFGRYYIATWSTTENVVYEACRYGYTTGSHRSNRVYKTGKRAEAKQIYDCESDVVIQYPLIYHTDNAKNDTDKHLKVSVNPDHRDERICTVGSDSFIFRPIGLSIQTAAIPYKLITNLPDTFDNSYLHPIEDTLSFSGATISGTTISFSGESYTLKTDSDNTNEPFLYRDEYNNNVPLFLNYNRKVDGTFTVHYIYMKNSFEMFEPIPLSHCKFQTSAQTVTAAPRVIQADESLIAIEVYFVLDNADFEFCIIEVEINYSATKTKVAVMEAAKSNAYYHVQQRSTTAANCEFGGRAVRWLLAYTPNNVAELVSLDDSVSSPIFECKHCGADTKMYCDVTPEAKKYRSSVFILTGEQVTYVRVVNTTAYQLKIETSTTPVQGEHYFVQSGNMTMQSGLIKLKLDGKSRANGDVSIRATTPSPRRTRKPYLPDETEMNEEYYSNWLGAANSYSPFWCLILIALIFLA